MTTSCDIFYLVQSDDTCDSIISKYSISLANFYAWNPSVGTSCSYLEVGVYVCIDLIGSSTVTTTSNTISTPSPIQTGVVTDCDKFYDVRSGDGCDAIASSEVIPVASFYAWNPAVQTDCADLYLSYYVCVGIATASLASTSA